MNVFLILIPTNRRWSRTIVDMLKEPDAALWWIVGGAAAFLTAILSVPFVRDTFHLDGLSLVDAGICVGGVAIVL